MNRTRRVGIRLANKRRATAWQAITRSAAVAAVVMAIQNTLPELRRHGRQALLSSAIALVIAMVIAPAAIAAPIGGSVVNERCEALVAQASTTRQAQDVADYCRASGRLTDQATHPGFQGETSTEIIRYWPQHLRDLEGGYRSPYHHAPGPEVADPYRLEWNWEERARGTSTSVEFANAHGAVLRGTLWLPPDATAVEGGFAPEPYPGIVIAPGGESFEEMYRWAAQGLAEAGYAVLTFDPQGHGSSDRCGTPTPQNGCPGAPGQLGYTPDGSQTHVVGISAALDWLLQGPYAGYVDGARIGLAGHSLGAWAALIVGHQDQRVDAIVAWDNFGVLPSELKLRVPTMLQGSEIRHACPLIYVASCRDVWGPLFPSVNAMYPGNLSTDDHPAVVNAERIRAARVPVSEIILRGSTHFEWAYAYGAAGYPASQKGERVAMYYTLAWFDRWVKAAVGQNGAARGNGLPGANDPLSRLVATTFDGSADASSIGTGRWDPLAGNIPYTIEGELVADHLSRFYRSQYDFGALECYDMRSGC